MTWNKTDQKPAGNHLSRKGGKVPVAPRGVVPDQTSLDDPENLPSVFEAMGIGVQGQGIYEDVGERFPAEMEQELLREHGWMPERQWRTIRRLLTRDVQSV